MSTLPKVELRANESQEQMLRRFNKSIVRSKVLADVRRKRWFISKSELKRIEKKKATRRQRKAQRFQGSTSTRPSSSNSRGGGRSSGSNSRGRDGDSDSSSNNRR